MKYRYALNSADETIDVLILENETRRVGAPFTCFGCGSELIPRLPKTKIKHFAHKSEQSCSSESYLHKLAKHMFYTKYKYCLDNNKPFYFNNVVNTTCTHYENTHGFTCELLASEAHDLTKYFDNIYIEKKHGGFIADVLLLSSKNDDVLFVEFAVSHKCEPEKIDSGIRIFEYQILEQESLDWINESYFPNNNLIKYNFNEKYERRDSCRGNCKEDAVLFILYESQRANVFETTFSEARNNLHRGKIIYKETFLFLERKELLNIHIGKYYVQGIRNAFYKKNIKFNNCYNCKYHGLNGYQGKAIFCKTLKNKVDSTEAIKCKSFKAYATLGVAKKADIANAEYVDQNTYYSESDSIFKDYK